MHKEYLAIAAVILIVIIAVPLAVVAANLGDAPAEADISLTSGTEAAEEDIIYSSDYRSDEVTFVVPESGSENAEDTDKLSDGEGTETETDMTEDTEPVRMQNDEPESDTGEDSVADGPESESETEYEYKFNVTFIYSDGSTVVAETGIAYLYEIMEKVGVYVDSSHEASMSIYDMVYSECTVYISDITYETVTEQSVVPFTTRSVYDSSMLEGEEAVVSEGSDGIRQSVYNIKYVNGIEVEREFLYDYVEVEPVDRVINIGTAGVFYAPDGTEYRYSRVITMRATYYNLPGHTASGMPVGDNVVAVDPSVIPLGTNLYVVNDMFDFGYRVAADTGVYGNTIDIWMNENSPNYAGFAGMGVTEVLVYILN